MCVFSSFIALKPHPNTSALTNQKRNIKQWKKNWRRRRKERRTCKNNAICTFIWMIYLLWFRYDLLKADIDEEWTVSGYFECKRSVFAFWGREQWVFETVSLQRTKLHCNVTPSKNKMRCIFEWYRAAIDWKDEECICF